MVGVFVGDQDGVKVVKVCADGRESRQRFTFSQASVNKDASAFGLEQRQIARTTGREDGNT